CDARTGEGASGASLQHHTGDPTCRSRGLGAAGPEITRLGRRLPIGRFEAHHELDARTDRDVVLSGRPKLPCPEPTLADGGKVGGVGLRRRNGLDVDLASSVVDPAHGLDVDGYGARVVVGTGWLGRVDPRWDAN